MSSPGRGLPAAWSGRSEAEWSAALGVPDLELYVSAPSTNARLLERALAGAEPFTTVIAGAQTRGRGRVGRTWYSPDRAGLWFSVLLSTGVRGEVGVLPLAVGAAAANALERFSREPVDLKWPNDLLIGDRKVGGILCEAVPEPAAGVVVGIGVNLRRPSTGYPTELEAGIALLEEERGAAVAEPDLAGALIDELRRWAQPAPARLSGVLRKEWERRDRLRGRRVRVDTGVAGRAVGIAEDGSLELAAPDGRTISVRAGSVRLDETGGSPALHGVADAGDDDVGARPGPNPGTREER